MKVWCVARETESSSDLIWFSSIIAEGCAIEVFKGEVASGDPNVEVNMWTFELPNETADADVTAEAERQMRERDYTPVRRHGVTP